MRAAFLTTVGLCALATWPALGIGGSPEGKIRFEQVGEPAPNTVSVVAIRRPSGELVYRVIGGLPIKGFRSLPAGPYRLKSSQRRCTGECPGQAFGKAFAKCSAPFHLEERERIDAEIRVQRRQPCTIALS
jgi:hypothetical protein